MLKSLGDQESCCGILTLAKSIFFKEIIIVPKTQAKTRQKTIYSNNLSLFKHSLYKEKTEFIFSLHICMYAYIYIFIYIYI